MGIDDKFYLAKITRRTDFASDLWSIRVNPGGEFKFRPGQYATLGLQVADKRVERAYSILSSPYEDELEFFFELVPEGELTPHLYKLQPGDEMLIRKIPKGRFLLETNGPHKNHLLISTVTGLCPFMSYLRSLVADARCGRYPEGCRLFLLNGASRSWEFGYHEEILKIACEAKWLTYMPTVSRPREDEKWAGETGRVDDLLRKYTDQWELTGLNTVAYMCGNPNMIQNCKGILQRRGFTRESLKEEVYWIPAKKLQRTAQ